MNESGNSALLVQGKDRYIYYGKNIAALYDLDPKALENQAIMQQRYEAIATATAK